MNNWINEVKLKWALMFFILFLLPQLGFSSWFYDFQGRLVDIKLEEKETLHSSFKLLKRSMVFLESSEGNISTGFTIMRFRRILSNSISISDEGATKVTLSDGSEREAEVLARNAELVLLSVGSRKGVVSLKIASKKPEIGDSFATIRSGKKVFGKVGKSFVDRWRRKLIKTSVKFTTHIHGTPALNVRGEIIGIFASGNNNRKYESLIPIRELIGFFSSPVPDSKDELLLSYESLKKASVFIRSGSGKYTMQSKGFVGPKNYIFTTSVSNSGRISVYLPNDLNPHEAVVVAKRPGIYILSLKDKIELHSLSLSPEDLKPFDEFVSIYYFFSESFIRGAKIGFGMTTESFEYSRVKSKVTGTSIRTPGHNDGIAALNARGEVIGMFTNIYPSRSREYMIPASVILKFLKEQANE